MLLKAKHTRQAWLKSVPTVFERCRFKGETLTDALNVPIKASLVMPFGTVTMERK